MQAEPSDTISTIKDRLRSQHSEVLDDQYLTYAGKQLEDDRTLADYSIGQGSTLELSSRLLGGCFYCHDCRHNPKAPAHTSTNCKDPRNAYGRGSQATGVRKDHGQHQHTHSKAATSNSEYGSHLAPHQGIVATWSSPKSSVPKSASPLRHARAGSSDLSLLHYEPASHHAQPTSYFQQHQAPKHVTCASTFDEQRGFAYQHAAAPWIEEVDQITPHHHARNSASVMLVNYGEAGISAFMVQEKNGHWGFVAGKIDPGEAAFTALLREYREEVGGAMPRLDAGRASAPGEPRKFVYHHGNGANTAVYAGFVLEAHLPTPRSFRPNREIRAVRLVPLQQVQAMLAGRHESMTMRPCAIGSTAAVLEAMHLG